MLLPIDRETYDKLKRFEQFVSDLERHTKRFRVKVPKQYAYLWDLPDYSRRDGSPYAYYFKSHPVEFI